MITLWVRYFCYYLSPYPKLINERPAGTPCHKVEVGYFEKGGPNESSRSRRGILLELEFLESVPVLDPCLFTTLGNRCRCLWSRRLQCCSNRFSRSRHSACSSSSPGYLMCICIVFE